MLFVRPTRLGRERELKVYKALERVQFRNPFPEKKPAAGTGAERDAEECTQQNADGSVSCGTKVDGVWEGPFTKTYPSGARWEGTFVDGKVEGKLTHIQASGNRLDGEWHNGNWNGPGTYYCSGRGVLRGVWKDGEVAGDAVYTYDDGSEYAGGVRDYLREGEGTLTWPGGAVLKGTFARDDATGPVEISFPNGDLYRGDWAGGISGTGEFSSRCCPGILLLRYKGPWLDGKPSGSRPLRGKLSLQVGKEKEYIYSGEFKDGNACGEGLLQCALNGDAAEPVASGLFANNTLTSGEKSLEVRTIESYLAVAARHIRQTVAGGFGKSL